MTSRLALVAPEHNEPQELGLYAETRMVADDHERWARCHIRGDRASPITLAERIRSVVRR